MKALSLFTSTTGPEGRKELFLFNPFSLLLFFLDFVP